MGESDPSNAEIGRRLNQLSDDVRDGFRTIDAKLGAYLPRESHAIHVEYTTREFTVLDGRIRDVRAELVGEIDALKQDSTSSVRFWVSTVVSILAVLIAVAAVLAPVVLK